jgi:hypothetical protein
VSDTLSSHLISARLVSSRVVMSYLQAEAGRRQRDTSRPSLTHSLTHSQSLSTVHEREAEHEPTLTTALTHSLTPTTGTNTGTGTGTNTGAGAGAGSSASLQPPPPPLPLTRSLTHSLPPPQEMREATISAAKCREVGKLFPIPVMPKLEKLAEPAPMKRVAPGYDMRTLRKQVSECV